MSGVNKMVILGRLGGDPKVHVTPRGDTMAAFSVATNERWKSRTGQVLEHTEWHRVVCTGDMATFVRDTLLRGVQVYVEGPVRTRDWTDRDGVIHKCREVIGFVVTPVGVTRPSAAPAEPPPSETRMLGSVPNVARPQPPAPPPIDDDLDF